MTICENLIVLYRSAVKNDRLGEASLIEDSYIMAKKMNRELMRHKYGELPVLENNSWDESDWHKDLRGSAK